MNTQDQSIAEAAARLTVQDFQYLEEHGMIRAQPSQGEKQTRSRETVSQEAGSQEGSPQRKKKRKRCSIKHTWPEPGTILEADYHGEHYEAEVMEARRYKSGRALKVLTGPAAGRIFSSMSGAMLAATQRQREEHGLGKKGVSNGWRFWKSKGGGAHENTD